MKLFFEDNRDISSLPIIKFSFSKLPYETFLTKHSSNTIPFPTVPMHVSHLLLGRPWQFDQKAIHDGFRNRFTIVNDGKTITLVPFSPKQVYDNQMKLKRKSEDGKSENSHEDNDERRPSDSAKPKSLIKTVESGGKTRGVKKVSLCDDNSVKKIKETN
jgi:hypothetical protein